MNRNRSATRPDPQLALATALTAIAGAVDAMGLARLKHFFVSFMSGNSTQLAAASVRGESGEAETAAALVATFFIGVGLGRVLRHAAGDAGRPVVLGVEALLLAGAAFATTPLPLAVGLMAFAMGVQNAVIHRAAGAKTGLTYVTGTLVHLAETCADAALGKGRLADIGPPLSLWLGFVCGATLGATAFGRLGVHAVALPVAALVALALAACFSHRLRGEAPD